jgi:hypothetical protein
MEEIPPNELKNLAKRFVLSVRKKNGEVFWQCLLKLLLVGNIFHN